MRLHEPRAKTDKGDPRCQAYVSTPGMSFSFHQCTRKAVEGDRCRIHGPTHQAEVRRRQDERYKAEKEARKPMYYGRAFLIALRKIASGQGDPVQVARDALREYDRGSM